MEPPALSANRVVMIATSWWRWESTAQDSEKIQKLLTTVLGGGSAEPSWVLAQRRRMECLAPEPSPLSPAFGSNAMAELYRQELAQAQWYPGTDVRAPRTVEEISTLLNTIGAEHQAESISPTWTLKRLRALDIRVFLSAARAAALFGIRERPVDFHVCLDVTFTRATIDDAERLLCLISASVWTDLPFSPAHAPRTRDPALPPPVVDVRDTVRFFQGEIRSRIEEFLPTIIGQELRRTVRSRPYLAPMFWVVVSADGRDHAEEIGQFLLQTPTTSTAVATSTVSDGLRVQRRLVPVADRLDVPVYAMAPQYAPLTDDTTPAAAAEAYCLQEEDASTIVTAITELEAQAAALFYDVDTDLTIFENYAHLYEVSAERASVLWDGLAMHLPVAEGHVLDQVHRAIALIHQGLLQGVADLNYLANKLDSTRAMLSRRAAELGDNCEQALAETGDANLRNALVKEGYVGFESRRAERAAKEVARIRDNFQGLFTSIGDAFDERRTRKTDRAGESSLLLGVVVAVFGLINVFDVTLGFRAELAGGWALTVRVIVAVLGVVLIVFVVGILRALRRQGRLGGTAFRADYAPVRDYLRVVSSNELKRLERGINDVKQQSAPDAQRYLEALVRDYVQQPTVDLSPRPEDRFAEASLRDQLKWRAWVRVDHELSGRLAAVWATAHREDEVPRSDDVVADVAALAANVEQWTLRGMLITERPPQLFRYPLPRLIAMYCALSARPDSMLRRTVFVRPEVNAISEVDLEFRLRLIGFSPEDVGSVYQWLSRHPDRDTETVAEIADRVARLGLKPGMHADDRAAALRYVAEARQPRPGRW